MSTVISHWWVHELDMFIYLILAIQQANKLSNIDSRNTIRFNSKNYYVYITC